MAAKTDIKYLKQSAGTVMFSPATVKDKCPGKAPRRQSTAVGAVTAPQSRREHVFPPVSVPVNTDCEHLLKKPFFVLQ